MSSVLIHKCEFRDFFSFEWVLILKSINVARTAADPYSFPIDCTFSICEEFGIEFIKIGIEKTGERVYLIFSASSRYFILIFANQAASRKNFLYVYGACCCCSLCCFSSVIIIFLNGKSAILHLYSLYIKSKERLTKATKWDMFHVWKVWKIIMMIILMMHDIDRCICKTCTKNKNILATSFNPLIT